MKRTVLLLPVAALLVILTTASCGGKSGLQHADALVTSTHFYHDSIMSEAKMTVDGDTMVFDMSEARFINGMMMAGDSVAVDFVETKSDTARAFVILRKERMAPAEPSADGELLTRPANEKPAAAPAPEQEPAKE